MVDEFITLVTLEYIHIYIRNLVSTAVLPLLGGSSAERKRPFRVVNGGGSSARWGRWGICAFFVCPLQKISFLLYSKQNRI